MSEEINRLISSLCQNEGKKSQIKIGDMREVIAILGQELYQSPQLALQLIEAGRKRWLKSNITKVKRSLLNLAVKEVKRARKKK